MSKTVDDVEQELLQRIKILSERLWEGKCLQPDVADWLENFTGRYVSDATVERLHALHLLASVSYFGLAELRVLLRSMYRDIFRYPIVQRIRTDLNNTRDAAIVESEFRAELSRTRFIGMGNPAESGTHLLYYFRQENRLSKALFVHQHELLTAAATDPAARLVDPALSHVVFVDDLCGSGHQSEDYSRTVLKTLRDVASRTGQDIRLQYLVLFGTTTGLDYARKHSDFDEVHAVCEMDSTYRTFGSDSRVFRRAPDHIDRFKSGTVAQGYGADLYPRHPLGYDDSQLLLALHHNVPNNSLPILWMQEDSSEWSPAFPRYPKV